MNPLPSISTPANLPDISQLSGAPTEGSDGFKNLLLEGLNQVNQVQVDADQAVQQLFTGGDVDPAEVLTAVQKADMAFRLMMQIRNKLVGAYEEVKDMRI